MGETTSKVSFSDVILRAIGDTRKFFTVFVNEKQHGVRICEIKN